VNFEQVIESPGFWLLSAIPALSLWKLWRWQRRRKLFHAFVEKHGLSTEQSNPIVDPGIKGLFFEATYPLWMEGAFEGVSVVAFDYMIGVGKNRQRGSGVGVRRRVLDAERMGAGLETTRQGEWTFVYGPRGIVLDHRMDPAEMESLWLRLLQLPAIDGLGEPYTESVVPGGVHIPPRRRP
jgi:hypothetical protein